MPEFEIRAIQGQVGATTLTFVTGSFDGDETLTASIGVGDNQAAALTVAPTWTAGQTAGSYTEADLSLSASQTAALPWGVYNVQVGIADGSAPLAYGWLTIYPGPAGTGTPFWRSLASPAMAAAYLPNLTQDQQDVLPHALGAATRAIEGYCQRPLVLDSYDHIIRPQNTSRLRLRTRPVVELTRCAAGLESAVQIRNTTATAATVNFVPSAPGSLRVTSLVFISTVAGVATSQTVALASYGTLTLLAAAINALGNGWSADLPNSAHGDVASSEVVGTAGARDARTGVAELLIQTQPLSQYWLDPDLGFVEINQSFPGGGTIANPRIERCDSRLWGVRCTYRAGYAYLKADSDLGYYTVPDDLAAACVMTASAIIESAATVGPVKSQTVKDRSYTLSDVKTDIPEQAKLILARYTEVVF
jgi:hypothetical protein